MTAELATLERKVDLVLARLDELTHRGQPGLTQRAFAKLTGVSARTVSRKIARKEIRLVKGLIPHAEARKYLS